MISKPHHDLMCLKMNRDHLEVEATALENKRGWAFETLMTAARELEAHHSQVGPFDAREMDMFKSLTHHLECNLTDAACAYSKAKDRAHRAWLKHGRAAKAANKADRCFPPVGPPAGICKGPVIQGVFDKREVKP
jgi:hypothetical protein